MSIDEYSNHDDQGQEFEVKARPQHSRTTKPSRTNNSRAKRPKRTGPVAGIHQRRNKRVKW